MARLRALAAAEGSVSRSALERRDALAMRSLHQHFASFEAARRAAGVRATPLEPRQSGHQRARRAVWSRGRVIDELRRLERAGESTAWAELTEAGRGDLVAAAKAYAGGLAQARALAGVSRPARRMPVPRWSRRLIVRTLKDRARKGESLASSKVPPPLAAAARWHFGSWSTALEAAGIDGGEVRLQRAPYTEEEILARIRELARGGRVVRSATLRGVVKLDTVRKLFGSVARAIRAAGAEVPRTHANQKWNRARVIEELRARAERGEVALTRGLERAAQLYFGGAPAARAAAGLPTVVREAWTAESLIAELRRRARRGDSGRTLWAACRRLFGSAAAARLAAGVPATQRGAGMVAWGKPALLAELRKRQRGRKQLSRGLVAGLRNAFGSLEAARQAAGPGAGRGAGGGSAGQPRHERAGGAAGRRRAWSAWSRAQVLDRLAAWNARGGGRLAGGLELACKHHFGSLAQARLAAKLPRLTVHWTAARIQRALRDASFDRGDPRFVAACIALYGSVTAARVAAAPTRRSWSRATVLAELQARVARGLTGVGKILREPAIRWFGSTEAALEAAGRARRRPPRGAGARRAAIAAG